MSVWKRTEGKPAARAAFVAASAGVAAFFAYLWWPNGEYKPIQKGEKGTLVGAVEQLGYVGTGRPALPAPRERKLRGAPFRSKEAATTGKAKPEPAQTTTTQTQTSSTSTTETSTTSTQTTQTSPGAGATVSTPSQTGTVSTTNATPTTTTP